MPAFQSVSGWITQPPAPQEPVRGDVRADVCVVGGGYTGLSTALALREEGRSVALVERAFAGHGASGRNTGHVAPTIGKDLPSLLRFFGLDHARQLLRFAETSVEHLEHLIAKYGIECDYEPNGNVLAGLHSSQQGKLRKAADAGKKLGGQFEWLDPGAIRERGLPPCFQFGVLERKGGMLNPGKLVLSLRQRAIDAGVQVFEKTQVIGIADGAPVRVATPEGAVTADTVVLATNAFTRSTGWLRHAVMPVTVTVIMTEPLNETQRYALGWPGREAVYTAHEVLESYRWTADGRLVMGTKHVRTGFGSHLPREEHEPTRDLLIRTLHERFPEIGTVHVEFWWSGYIAFTMDFLPRFGVTGRHRNIYYGFAYAGHGLPQACHAGRILADLINDRRSDFDLLTDRRIFPVPPEPLAWFYGKALSGALHFLDRRLDAKIRAMPHATRPSLATDPGGDLYTEDSAD